MHLLRENGFFFTKADQPSRTISEGQNCSLLDDKVAKSNP
jgi:hypothetical protein